MKIERIDEGFAILPSISLNWVTWHGERHYYLIFAWLFWLKNTLRKYPWEDKQCSTE
jgi:hypothetical protein